MDNRYGKKLSRIGLNEPKAKPISNNEFYAPRLTGKRIRDMIGENEKSRRRFATRKEMLQHERQDYFDGTAEES